MKNLTLNQLIKKNKYSKREKLEVVLAMRKIIQKLGDYENCLDGFIGEVYAQSKFNMVKKEAYTASVDGLLRGKRTQVKAKGGRKKYELNEHYAAINAKHRLNIDSILMVMINKRNKIRSYGPFDRAKCDEGRIRKSNGQIRYYLHHMIQANQM